VKAFDYSSLIDAVTTDQVNKIVSKILSGQPTFVAQGPEVAKLYTVDKIVNSLKGWFSYKA